MDNANNKNLSSRRQCSLSVLLALGVALLLAAPAFAQEKPENSSAGADGANASSPQGLGPIVPNRPGFTNGSATVAPGDALAENGLALSRDSAANGGMETLDYPQTTLRLGVAPALEADITLPDYYQVRGGDHGFGDGAVGVKYRFYQSRDGSTKASLAPSLSLPTHTAFSSGQVDPTLLLGIQTASGSRWSIASNLVLSSPTQNERRIFTTTGSGSVSYTLTSSLSVYVDAYDMAPRTGPPVSEADGGFTYLVNKNLQLDAEMYVGLSQAAPVRRVAVGVSFRL